MKIKEIIEECKKRPTKVDCKLCPYSEECGRLRLWFYDSCPSEYERVTEVEF